MDEAEKDVSLLGFGYFSLLILPSIISLVTGVRTDPINFPDIVDLVAFFPFMVYVLYRLRKHLLAESGVAGSAYIALFATFFEGHGIHWAANAVDLLQHGASATEVCASEQCVTAQSIAFFLDEYLGHKVMFYALLGMLALLYFLGSEDGGELGWAGRIAGGLFGFSLMVSTTEGRTGYEALAFLIVLLMYALLKMRRGEELSAFQKFMLIASATGIAVSAVWLAMWGALIEPSKVFSF